MKQTAAGAIVVTAAASAGRRQGDSFHVHFGAVAMTHHHHHGCGEAKEMRRTLLYNTGRRRTPMVFPTKCQSNRVSTLAFVLVEKDVLICCEVGVARAQTPNA